MLRVFRATLLAVFLFTSAAVSAASLEQGLTAYARGDYETALANCQPLAEDGNIDDFYCGSGFQPRLPRWVIVAVLRRAQSSRGPPYF